MKDLKRILIVTHAMELGGAERALLGLLDALDYSSLEIDLFLMRHEGELYHFINSNVNILPEIDQYSLIDVPLIETIKRGHYLIASCRLYGRYKSRFYIKKNHFHDKNSVAIEYSHKYVYRILPQINPFKQYDLAISFLSPHYCVAEKVNAKKKVAWIHTDYSSIEIDIRSEFQMWNKYDNIVSISKSVTDSFVKVFPTLRTKIVQIENILPMGLITKQVNEFDATSEIKPDSETWSLLSIGRFAPAKNFDNVPRICKMILEEGINVRWYLIGYGIDEQLIKQNIASEGVQNHVILLGKKDNPYPYIKACDLYVQPSRFEGKAVTVREAQTLCKPVAITRFSTSQSQLEDGIDGVILPMDNAGCARGIAEILQDSSLMKRLSDNCAKRDYSNSAEVAKFNELL